MGLFDGLRANKAASRAYPLLDRAIEEYGDPNGIVRSLRHHFAGIIQAVQQAVDQSARSSEAGRLNGQQRAACADIYRAAMLREAMEYLLQWRATQRRNSVVLDALCVGITGQLPMDFEPLQRLIEADSKYPGIPANGRKAWQFGKDFATAVYGPEGAVPSTITASITYYAPVTEFIMGLLDAIMHLSQGPEGVTQG